MFVQRNLGKVTNSIFHRQFPSSFSFDTSSMRWKYDTRGLRKSHQEIGALIAAFSKGRRTNSMHFMAFNQGRWIISQWLPGLQHCGIYAVFDMVVRGQANGRPVQNFQDWFYLYFVYQTEPCDAGEYSQDYWHVNSVLKDTCLTRHLEVVRPQ